MLFTIGGGQVEYLSFAPVGQQFRHVTDAEVVLFYCSLVICRWCVGQYKGKYQKITYRLLFPVDPVSASRIFQNLLPNVFRLEDKSAKNTSCPSGKDLESLDFVSLPVRKHYSNV